MSMTNSFETNLLELLFNNSELPKIGDSSGLQPSGADGNFYVALFTTAPTESTGGVEADYTGYSRIAVARTSSGWTISGNEASNTAKITFAECESGSNSIEAFGILTGTTNDDLLWYGSCSIEVSLGVIPEFDVGALTITAN